MQKPIASIPAKDANESTKAYRERIAKEKAEEQQRQQFKKFVTEKREDYIISFLGAMLANPQTDKNNVEENVELASNYANSLLHKLYNIRLAKPENKPQPAEKAKPQPTEEEF